MAAFLDTASLRSTKITDVVRPLFPILDQSTRIAGLQQFWANCFPSVIEVSDTPRYVVVRS
jgi:hypothetical protein